MHTPSPFETPHAGLQRVPPTQLSYGDLVGRRDAAMRWMHRVARRTSQEAADCWELAVHDGRIVADWTVGGARRVAFGSSVLLFSLLQVPAAIGRWMTWSPARRPWYAVHPQDWPANAEWLKKLRIDSDRDDVFTPTPLAGAFSIGRTLPRTPTPEGWWEPVRRAWVVVHTTEIWIPLFRRYRHLLILGGPGTGKTSRWVLPGLVRDLAGDGQILTVDAKGGEQYALLRAAARRAGVRPVCLDPWSARYTAAIEPIGDATPTELEVLADALYGGAASRDGGDEFWDAYAKAYLRFLLTLVALFPRASRAVPCVAWLATEETPRVTQLADAILQQYRNTEDAVAQHAVDAILTIARTDAAVIADVSARPDAVVDALAVLEFLPNVALDLVYELRARVADGGTITGEDSHRVAAVVQKSLREHAERLAAARRQIRELERTGMEKLAGSTRATLAAHLRAFTAPEVARFLSRPEIDLWSFASAPERQLVCVGTRPGQGAASEQVTALIVKIALQSVYTRNERPAADPVRRRSVWLYLDEVAQLKLRDLPRHVALVRSMNAGIILAAQDLSQLRALYGEEAIAIENSCGTVVALDSLEDATAERYADRCGTVRIHTRVPTSARDRRWDDHYDVRNRLEGADLRVRRINNRIRQDAAFQAAGSPYWFSRPAPFFEDPSMRTSLGLERSGNRWVPAEPPASEREAVGAAASDRSPDPYAETVLALVGVPAGRERPALRMPSIPWRAFGLAADDERPSQALGAGAQLLAPG